MVRPKPDMTSAQTRKQKMENGMLGFAEPGATPLSKITRSPPPPPTPGTGGLNRKGTLHTGKFCFLNIKLPHRIDFRGSLGGERGSFPEQRLVIEHSYLIKPSCLNKCYQGKTCTFSGTQGQTNLILLSFSAVCRLAVAPELVNPLKTTLI